MAAIEEQDILETIRGHVEAKDFTALKALIRESDVYDLIELLAELPEEDSAYFFSVGGMGNST